VPQKQTRFLGLPRSQAVSDRGKVAKARSIAVSYRRIVANIASSRISRFADGLLTDSPLCSSSRSLAASENSQPASSVPRCPHSHGSMHPLVLLWLERGVRLEDTFAPFAWRAERNLCPLARRLAGHRVTMAVSPVIASRLMIAPTARMIIRIFSAAAMRGFGSTLLSHTQDRCNQADDKAIKLRISICVNLIRSSRALNRRAYFRHVHTARCRNCLGSTVVVQRTHRHVVVRLAKDCTRRLTDPHSLQPTAGFSTAIKELNFCSAMISETAAAFFAFLINTNWGR
jgi:hypothetical protein